MQLGQRLAQMQVMSPQMQQSLAFLQAPMLDLRSMINKELQENPVLEELSPDEGALAENGDATAEAPEVQSPEGTQVDPTAESNGEPVDDFSKELERLAEMSEEWRDHFSASQVAPVARPSEDDDERRQFLMESITSGTSLQDLLMEQSNQSDLDLEEMKVAEEIIGNIDDNGFLQVSVEELVEATGCDREVVEETLSVIRSFEPAGVGARDLRECLLLQLERQGKIDSDEYKLVEQHMDALGRRRFPEIAKALGVENDEVQDIAKNISHLDPRPGSAFQSSPEQYVMPEVFVNWKDDQWEVTSNREEVPQLRISNSYKDLLTEARDSKDVREYIRAKIRDGNFLINSIHQRQDTILNIAREIVARQEAFMDEGVSALKPMTMSEIAEKVGVHETTVSRAVSGKYIKTPQGLFEMRFFFTGAIATGSGKGVSNTSVKQMIADLVEDENKAKPLSDEQLVKLLSENDIKIARRTVAKYRGELGLLSSSMRRVY
ncbi:MAG: RNA polymerase factor sigma-54 [Verrucomicrobiota bacterium]|nr:RNA polymerase factor sigma-54 [Verrucomicrobiota bacterium]